MTTKNTDENAPAALRCGEGFGFWAVCHEDHDTDLHGPHPKFATESEACAACDRWNKDIAGHHAYYVPPPPAEFTSLPNNEGQTDGGNITSTTK